MSQLERELEYQRERVLKPLDEYCYEIFGADGNFLAGGSAPTAEAALRELAHCRMVYSNHRPLTEYAYIKCEVGVQFLNELASHEIAHEPLAALVYLAEIGADHVARGGDAGQALTAKRSQP